MSKKMQLTFILLFIVSGCSNVFKKAEVPPPEEPGPKSKEEALNLISPAIQPLRNTSVPGAPGLSEEQRQQVMMSLHNVIVTYGSNQYGKEALRELGYEVLDLAKKASASERYRLALACIEAAELLQVDSLYLKRLGPKAELMLKKPKVAVKGFVDDIEKKQLYVFLELTDHLTGKTERLEAREGDEFHDLRLVRVIGNNKAVLLEYLKMPGLFFEVEAF